MAAPSRPVLHGVVAVPLGSVVTLHDDETGEPEKDALAIGTQGRWFGVSGPLTATFGSGRFPIAPNFDADSTVAFEVRETAEIARIRLTLNAGAPTQTADWTVA